MRRQVSTRGLLNAGVDLRRRWIGFRTAEPLFAWDSYRIWRSGPDYRRLCRILRRAGVRIGGPGR